MKGLLEEAKLLQEQIVADRRYLHQIQRWGWTCLSRRPTLKSGWQRWVLSPTLRRDGGECTAEIHQDGIP